MNKVVNIESSGMEEALKVEMESDMVAPPPMFAVWLLNDDYTPMDFVVTVLVEVFNKEVSEATVIMLRIHNEGRAICGIYAFDTAETLAAQVMNLAQAAEYPLQCLVEEVQSD